MNTAAITIPRNNHSKGLEAFNHQSKSTNSEKINCEGKKKSEYEKAFLEMTDEEMKSLIATMNEE